jgi:hypothetical protein
LTGLIDRARRDAWGVLTVEFADQALFAHMGIIVHCEEFLYLNYYEGTYLVPIMVQSWAYHGILKTRSGTGRQGNVSKRVYERHFL